MLESQIESTVAARALSELGVFSIKIKAAQERGYPDRLFLIPNGVPLFIEFKRRGKKPEPYQTMIHKRLRHANYQVQVHDDIESAMQSIRAAMEASAVHAQGGEVASGKSCRCALLRPRTRQD